MITITITINVSIILVIRRPHRGQQAVRVLPVGYPWSPSFLGFLHADPRGGGEGLLNQAGAFSATGRSRTRYVSILDRHFVDFDF